MAERQNCYSLPLTAYTTAHQCAYAYAYSQREALSHAGGAGAAGALVITHYYSRLLTTTYDYSLLLTTTHDSLIITTSHFT